MKANIINQTTAGNENVQAAGFNFHYMGWFCMRIKPKEFNRMKAKSFWYRGWYCQWIEPEGFYCLYTPEEMEHPYGWRYHEYSCGTKAKCKRLIDSY
jgi:hypothetical protein